MDYIPTRLANQIAWLVNCASVVSLAPTTYGIAAPQALAFQNQVDLASGAYAIGVDPSTRTPVTVQNMNDQMAAAVTLAREINVQAQALPSTSPQLVAAGFPVRSTVRTPQSPVTASADIELVSLIVNEITVQARNPATPTTKAKPAGTGAVQYAIAVGTVAAVSPSQATEYRFATRSPARLEFLPEQRGKIVTMWARYQSRGSIGGQRVYGPYGIPITVSLP